MKGKTPARPFRKFWGLAYDKLVPGSNPTKKITAKDHTNPHQVYNDIAVRLSEADIAELGVVGKPICVEHDTNVEVGIIHHAEPDKETGKLRVMGRIYTDTDAGRRAAAAMDDGVLKGLSVGYTAHKEEDSVDMISHKSFTELTLTERPFFDGCEISVAASAGASGNTISGKSTADRYKSGAIFVILSKLGAEEMTAEVAQMPNHGGGMPNQGSGAPPVSEQGALLNTADKLVEQLSERDARLEQEAQARKKLEERLAVFEAREKQEDEAYTQKMLPRAQAAISSLEKGQGKPFDEEARNRTLRLLTTRASAVAAENMFAMAAALDAAAATATANAELQVKLSKKEAEMAEANARLTAPRQEALSHTAPAQTVPSVGTGSQQSQAISSYGGSDIDVNASANATSATGDAFFRYRGLCFADVFQVPPRFSADELAMMQKESINPNVATSAGVQGVRVAASKNAAGVESNTINIKASGTASDPMLRHTDYSMRWSSPHWMEVIMNNLDALAPEPDASAGVKMFYNPPDHFARKE